LTSGQFLAAGGIAVQGAGRNREGSRRGVGDGLPLLRFIGRQQLVAVAVEGGQHLRRGGNLFLRQFAVAVSVEKSEQVGPASGVWHRSEDRERAVLEIAVERLQFLERHLAVAVRVESLEVEGDVNVRPAEVREADDRRRRAASLGLIE